MHYRQTSDSYATKTQKICYAFMQLKPEKYAPKIGFMQYFYSKIIQIFELMTFFYDI